MPMLVPFFVRSMVREDILVRPGNRSSVNFWNLSNGNHFQGIRSKLKKEQLVAGGSIASSTREAIGGGKLGLLVSQRKAFLIVKLENKRVLGEELMFHAQVQLPLAYIDIHNGVFRQGSNQIKIKR